MAICSKYFTEQLVTTAETVKKQGGANKRPFPFNLHTEKMDLLNVAKENAVKILGVQNLELPASVKSLELQTKKPEEKQNVERNVEERVSADHVPLKKPAQVGDGNHFYMKLINNAVRTSLSLEKYLPWIQIN